MILLKLYNILITLLSFIAKPYLLYRVKQCKEDPKRLNERFGRTKLKRPDGKLIWCHVASVGEAISVKPLITEIEQEFPQIHILITSGTLTSSRMINSFYSASVIHQFLPFDHRIWINQFLNHWRPNLILWTESEIWPNFMLAIRKKRIPSYLINARISKNSFKNWSKTPKLFDFLLRTFKLCFPQNSETEKYLKSFNMPNIKFIGNLKLSAPPLPVDTSQYEHYRHKFKNKHIYLLASSHPGEEELFFKIHKSILKTNKNTLLIIAPRHPNRGTEIATLAQEKFKFNVNLKTSKELITSETNLYIADTIGELGLFYQLADIVFIGGSFIPHGGHNPLEACYFNCNIIFGKYMENFKDIALQLLANSAAKQFSHSKDIKPYLIKQFKQKRMDKKIAENAKIFIENQQNIPKLILDEIKASMAYYSFFES